MSVKPVVEITNIGGYCPVQAEGTIDGQEFYFRARGQRWTIGIGGDTVMKPDWSYEQPYGKEPYEAGWMEVDEARALIALAADAYAIRSRRAKAWETRRAKYGPRGHNGAYR